MFIFENKTETARFMPALYRRQWNDIRDRGAARRGAGRGGRRGRKTEVPRVRDRFESHSVTGRGRCLGLRRLVIELYTSGKRRARISPGFFDPPPRSIPYRELRARLAVSPTEALRFKYSCNRTAGFIDEACATRQLRAFDSLEVLKPSTRLSVLSKIITGIFYYTRFCCFA